MFLSGTVLCTINTLVEHGLKNAVPVMKTRCASDHFAAPPHPCTKALRLHARKLRARRAPRASAAARAIPKVSTARCVDQIYPQCRPRKRETGGTLLKQ